MFLRFLFYIILFSTGYLSSENIGNYYDLTQVTSIELAAVGRVASMGELYDARSDTFLHLTIFNSPLPNTSIISTENRQTQLKYSFENSLEEKFNTLDISASLKISIMGGLLGEMEGSGKFFKDTKTSAKSAKACVVNSISTVYERISITETYFKSIINFDTLQQIDATHVVVGIQWGGSVFVSVEDTNIDEQSQQEVQGNLKAEITWLTNKITGDSSVNITDKERKELSKFNFELYGDILPDQVPENLIDAMIYMKNVTKALQTANSGKGKAMKYILIPISLLRELLAISAKVNTILKNIDETTVQQCVKMFDDINRVEQKLTDLVDSVQQFDKYIATNKVQELNNLKYSYQKYQSEVKTNLSDHLILVRSGNESAVVIQDLMMKAGEHPFSYLNIGPKLEEQSLKLNEEISFLKYLLKLNVTLLAKDKTLNMFLLDYSVNDVYFLCYSHPNPSLIGKPIDLFIKLIESEKTFGTTDIFAAINNDIFNDQGPDSKLMYYRKMKLIANHFETNWTNPDNETDVWPISYIQDQLIKVKDQQDQIIEQIHSNLIPIGFIYTQLPKKLEPKKLWPSFEWTDVTGEYAGLFFRAEGGGSLPFGQSQTADNPKLTNTGVSGMCDISRKRTTWQDMSLPVGHWSPNIINDIGSCAPFQLHFYISNVENRPVNTAVRIWKRTD